MVEYQPTSLGSISLAVLALGVDDGKVVWRKSFGTQPGVWVSLVANESAAYVINQVPSLPSQDPLAPIASVQALDGESGKVLWEANMPPHMGQIYCAEGWCYSLPERPVSAGPEPVSPGCLTSEQWQAAMARKHTYDQISVLDGQNLYGYKGYASSDMPQWKEADLLAR